MKEIVSEIDFADSSYKSCQTENGDLIVYLNSWDDRKIKIIFKNAIHFIFKGGGGIVGIFEKTNTSASFLETLSLYYEHIPKNHPFKEFVVIDVEDSVFFEIIAEKVSVIKE